MVVVTVPHAQCPPIAIPTSHPCDLLAPQAARCLWLKQEKIDVHRPFFGTIPRTECDLNRVQCRNTSYRKRVREFVLENQESTVFVLDIHSYPPDTNEWTSYELVVLDDSTTKPRDYSFAFVDFMKDSGIPILLGKGKGNDILVEMRGLGQRSFLLEFNESLMNDPNRFREICDAIVLWLNTLV